MPPASCLMPGESIGLQVDEDGTRDVARFVSCPSGLTFLPTEVDHAQARIAQVGGQPGGVDERPEVVQTGAQVT